MARSLRGSTEWVNSVSDKPVPVWVTHTPTPDNISDDDANSTGHTSSTPPYAERENDDNKGSMRNRLRTLLPQSWGSVIQKWRKGNDNTSDSEASSTRIKILPNGTRVSPPVSPLLERRCWDAQEGSVGNSSQSSHKPLLRDSPIDDDLLHQAPQEESLLTSIHPAEYYAEKVEVYKLKYSYLKSWPGLLRLLAGLELLFGGMVFACIIAYIQKDSEWSNAYGLYNGMYNNGLGVSGYGYRGPMTPFILAVAGVSWIITLALLVMGMTMYYRTILLDSKWWPLTEAFINVALFLLYMSAGIVYLNDLNRGGLCYMTIGINPIMANLCRVDGGQMAGTAFIFINMLMYLMSFLVCLRMWRHEATRREREQFANMVSSHCTDLMPPFQEPSSVHTLITEVERDPLTLSKTVEPGYIPKIQVVADYIIRYPEINSVEERERYKAVFNDQYQEYKDLHRDISTALSKFRELDTMMDKLLRDGGNCQWIFFCVTSQDPAFLEKKERHDYLKAKLSHIKNKIRRFDEDSMTNGRMQT
uniref:MARVEL domain containing 2-like n=1 Tax=Myripristis murdjan TaxID=586833 RepID=A0A667Y7N5_9TELE